jgi:ribosomal protein L19E
LQDCVESFEKEICSKKQELDNISILLDNEKKNVNIAVEAAKRRQKIEEQQDFYRLVLTAEDITEIKRLREVLPYLRDKTALNKVIYKVYYEKPLSDMIGRVVGTG